MCLEAPPPAEESRTPMDSRIYQDPDKADADEVLDLSDDVAQQAQSVSQLSALVESQAQEVQALQSQLSSLSQALTSLQAQVAGMAPSVGKIPSIEESVSELSAGQSSQDFQIQGINSQLSDLETGKQDKGSYVKFRSSATANVEFTTNEKSAQPFQLWYDYGNDGTKRQGLVINETGTTLGLFDSKGQKWLWRAVGQMDKAVKNPTNNGWNYVTFSNGLFIGFRLDSATVAFNGGPSGSLYYSANRTINFPISLEWAIVAVAPRADPGVFTAWLKGVTTTSFTYAMARTSNTSATMYNQIIVIGWLA